MYDSSEFSKILEEKSNDFCLFLIDKLTSLCSSAIDNIHYKCKESPLITENLLNEKNTKLVSTVIALDTRPEDK